MARNWDEIGLAWSAESVSRRHGENASDKSVIGTGQIPVVSDLDKVREHFGDEVITGALNGTSWRVMAQDVSRRSLEKDIKDAETIREAVYNRLRGIRNPAGTSTRTVEVKVYALPNGETYKGTDLAAYQAEYAAALVDQGVPAETAMDIAKRQTL